MRKNHLYLILALGFPFNFGEVFAYFREKVFKYFKNLLQNSKLVQNQNNLHLVEQI